MTGIYVFELFGAGLVAGPSPGSIFAYLALTPRGGFIGTCAGVLAGTVVSFVVATVILKLDTSPAEDNFADSQTANKKRKAEGKSGTSPLAARINLIAFVCDAGMGSSAMGATTFRKKLEKAGYAIEVKHYSIENIPADADIIVTHASLEGRAQRVTEKPLILIKNYLGDPALDALLTDITSQPQQGALA
jgi:PTS system mannitol-specific IIC component